MKLRLNFDMRAPENADRPALYRSAIEISNWADRLGFDRVVLREHHSTKEGSNPSPLILASAIAAQTRSIDLCTAILIAPLYDPIKLAEDSATVQTISNGRLLLGLGGGYRKVEFDTFGRDLGDRWDSVAETCRILRMAWSGVPFDWNGLERWVTPRPSPVRPPILLGGASANSARRAARIADGWLPAVGDQFWDVYRNECIAVKGTDPGPYPASGPSFFWVSRTPQATFEAIAPSLYRHAESYLELLEASPYASEVPQTLDFSDIFHVMTPDAALQLAGELGPDGVLTLDPLLAGIDISHGKAMLELFEQEVYPHLPR